MTIYYFGIYENNGGLENFAKNLISEISSSAKNIKFTILAINSNFSFRSYFENLGCKVIVLPNPHTSPIKFYKSLLSILNQAEEEDVLHLNICSYRNYFLFKAAKKSRIKTIIVGHYTKIDDGKARLLHFINRQLFKKLGTRVTNSPDVTKFMFNNDKNCVFIDNGTDLEKFSFRVKDREEIRNLYSIGESFLIGQIGRISPEKNQIFIVKVVEKLLQQGFNIKLLLVGKEMNDEVKEYVLSKKLNEKILLIGPVSKDIQKFYSAFDLCVLPSKNEGMSLSLLECASNGLTCFMSSAVPRLKVDLESIHYFNLDEMVWVEEIIKEIQNPQILRKNVLTGSVYDIKVCANKYVDLYNLKR